MMTKVLLVASAAAAAMLLSAVPASAGSTYPYTCSNATFEYSASGQATIAATCLQANGMPHQTSLVLMGISNQNGRLTQGTGNSTFQQSCGSIKLTGDGPNVALSAYCRMSNGSSQPTSLSLNNIGNNNGNLVQQ
jgi:hypothetical protein